MNSNKLINKVENIDEPMRDFKKNRNMSTNSSNGNQMPININIPPNIAFGPSQQMPNSQPIQQLNNPSSNIIAPNSKPLYIEQSKPNYPKEGKVGD